MKKNKNNNDRWQGYTPADCDCKYCVYYGGKKNGNVICLADTCVCSDEIRHAKQAYRRERMEVKINREIRNYTESMFFGLSLRQFIFSVLACAVAVGLYFLLKPYLGTETVSWVCILGAAPFAALGFVKYNGMTAEKFIWAWIKSEFLMPKKLVFHSTNTYYELMKPTIEQKQKEAYKNND
mgnify:CR=1 FL=1